MLTLVQLLLFGLRLAAATQATWRHCAGLGSFTLSFHALLAFLLTFVVSRCVLQPSFQLCKSSLKKKKRKDVVVGVGVEGGGGGEGGPPLQQKFFFLIQEDLLLLAAKCSNEASWRSASAPPRFPQQSYACWMERGAYFPLCLINLEITHHCTAFS